MNKLQWNFNWSLYIFIQENACENVVWKMAAILSQPQCVNSSAMHQYGRGPAEFGNIFSNKTLDWIYLEYPSMGVLLDLSKHCFR